MSNEENKIINNSTSSLDGLAQPSNKVIQFVDEQIQTDVEQLDNITNSDSVINIINEEVQPINNQPQNVIQSVKDNNVDPLVNVTNEKVQPINNQSQNVMQSVNINNVDPLVNVTNEEVQPTNNQPQNVLQSVNDNNVDPLVNITNEGEQSLNNQLQNGIQQSYNNYENTNFDSLNGNNTNNKVNKKSYNSKVKWLLLIGGILLVVVIILSVILIKNKNESNNNNNNNNNQDNIVESTSFFLQNNDKYALFNEDGDRLTDFIFKHAFGFGNGSALVMNDSEYGIVDQNGKMIADFGKYESINTVAGLYKACDVDSNCYLLDGKGKILYDLKNITFDSKWFVNTFLLLKDNKNNKYIVLNYYGKEIITIPFNKKIDEDPIFVDSNNYMSLFYDKKNYILDGNTCKKIVTFDSNELYKFSSTDNGVPILYSSDDNKNGYIAVKDGKIINISSECETIRYSEKNYLCIKEGKPYFMDSNMNVGPLINKKQIFDNKNYATSSEGYNAEVDIYKNGKKVKTVKCRDIYSSGSITDEFYLLGTYSSSACNSDSFKFEYYNRDGEKVIDKSFADAKSFTDNNLAVVSDDEENYYLINRKGEKVSQDYSKILLRNGYYLVTRDNLQGVLDSEGKVLLECEYNSLDISYFRNDMYVKLFADGYKIIYNLTSKKEIIRSQDDLNLSLHYIKSNGEKKQYYTYEGKKFFEN